MSKNLFEKMLAQPDAPAPLERLVDVSFLFGEPEGAQFFGYTPPNTDALYKEGLIIEELKKQEPDLPPAAARSIANLILLHKSPDLGASPFLFYLAFYRKHRSEPAVWFGLLNAFLEKFPELREKDVSEQKNDDGDRRDVPDAHDGNVSSPVAKRDARRTPKRSA